MNRSYRLLVTSALIGLLLLPAGSARAHIPGICLLTDFIYMQLDKRFPGFFKTITKEDFCRNFNKALGALEG